MIHTFISVVIPITMFSLMFGMGLTLRVKDFKRVLFLPKATIIGFVTQLIIMPLIGQELAHIFSLQGLLVVGFVATSASPGGITSNIIIYLDIGDTALSITDMD